MDKVTLEFNQEELNIMLAGLYELPFKTSQALVTNVIAQINAFNESKKSPANT